MSRVENERVLLLEKYIRHHAQDALVNLRDRGLDEDTVAMSVSGGFAFLQVVRSNELHSRWYRLQKQIAHVRDLGLAPQQEPDLYLVLLTEDRLNRLDLKVQAIARDPYVCRKLIVEWGDRKIEQVMAEMPFWSLGLPRQVSEVPPVAETMAEQGYNSEAIDALLTTGADTLAERLLHKPGYAALTWTQPPLKPLHKVIRVRRRGEAPAQPTTLGAAESHRWRLKEIVLDGFRAYKGRQSIDLSANLVAIYAPNGTGKTSLCEGIEWALTGQAHRIDKQGPDAPENPAPPVRHVERDAAKVTLTLEKGAATKVVEHTYDGDVTRWTVDDEEAPQRDLIARALEAEIPPQRHVTWIRDAFLRYHYLEQGTSFDFLRNTKPEKRYEVFQLMMGGAEYTLARDKLKAVAQVLEAKKAAAEEEIRLVEKEHAVWHGEAERLAREAEAVLTEVAGHDLVAVTAQAWQTAVDLGLVAGDVQAPSGERALAELIDSQATIRLQDADNQLRTLRSLPAQLAERASTAGKLAQLQADLANYAGERTTTVGRRAEVQAQVNARLERRKQLDAELAANRSHLAGLERLLQLQVRLDESHIALDRAEQQRAVNAEKEQAKRAELAAPEALLAKNQERLQELQQLLQGSDRYRSELDTAQVALNAWLAADETRQKVVAELAPLGQRLQNLLGARDAATAKEADLKQGLAAAEREAADLRQAMSDRHKLLAALQAHIDGCQCPLCGSTFDDRDALARAVAAALKAVPPALTHAEKRIEKILKSLRSQARLVKRLGDELDGLRARRAELEQAQTDLLAQQTTNASVIQRHLGNLPVGPQTRTVIEQKRAELTARIESAQAEVGVLERAISDLSLTVGHLKSEQATLQTALDEAKKAKAKAGRALKKVEAEQAQLAVPLPDGETADQAAGRIAAELQQAEFDRSQVIDQLEGAQAELDDHEKRLTALSELEQRLQSESAALREELAALTNDLAGVGLPADASAETVTERIEQTERFAGRLRTLGGMVVLLRAAAALKESRSSYEQARTQGTQCKATLEGHQKERDRIKDLLDQCDKLEKQLKGEASRLVKDRESHFKPTILHMYHRLNAHPYFNDVKLTIDEKAEKFLLQVVHPKTNQPVGGVAQYYSMAQVNIVTLSVFLAQALLQGWSRLSTIILDDPVQHLDDMNTYALLDLFQVLAKMGRQLIITTSDRQIYKLMLIKFSALNREGQKQFRAYRLQGLGENGPNVVDDTALLSTDK